MKILHLPFTYYPDAVGGTEVYVTMLAQELQKQSIENFIAAPGIYSQTYEYDGLPVWRYSVGQVSRPAVLYGAGHSRATENFVEILNSIHPDIVHLHALTAGVSLDIAKAVKRRGCRVVFTYHTPTVTCLRGTLMRWGDTICDGLLETSRCACCMLHSRGLHRNLSQIIGHIPPSVGRFSNHLSIQGDVLTALQMSYFAQLRHHTIRQFFNLIDSIVVLCNWVGEILRRNAVPESKITLSRHGLAPTVDAPLIVDNGESVSGLHLVFLGRLHPTKGIDIVIQAIRGLPHASVRLDIYGIIQEGDDAYVEQLRQLIEADERIRLLEPIPHDFVQATVSRYEALVVPSRWLETGPLVILEAFAVGIPVLGSELGGIVELVTHGRDGLLIEVGAVHAWEEALKYLLENPDILADLKSGIRPPRTILDVANDMLRIYNRCLSYP